MNSITFINRANASLPHKPFDRLDLSGCRVIHPQFVPGFSAPLAGLRGRLKRFGPQDVVQLQDLVCDESGRRTALPFFLAVRWSPKTALQVVPTAAAGSVINLPLTALLKVDDPSSGSVTVTMQMIDTEVVPVGQYPVLAEASLTFSLSPLVVQVAPQASQITLTLGTSVAAPVTLLAHPPANRDVNFAGPHDATYRRTDPTSAMLIAEPASQGLQVPITVGWSLTGWERGSGNTLTADSLLRWRQPYEEPLLPSGASHYDAMPALVHCRKAGRVGRVSVIAQVNPVSVGGVLRADPRFVADTPAEIAVTIKDAVLKISLEPSPADAGPAAANWQSPLVLEYDWLPDERKLVGSFVLQVHRVADGEDPELIFDSRWESTIATWSFSDTAITLSDIVTIPPESRLSRPCPFRLLLTLRDHGSAGAAVARFWRPAVEQGPAPVRRSLQRVISAVGAGQAELLVELLPLNNRALEIDEIPIGASSQQVLAIKVPPPLEAELKTWTDGWFTNLDISDPTGVHDVIFSSGRVTGAVRHRAARPHPELETVTVEAVTRSGTIGPFNVPGPGPAFTHDVRDMEVGGNRLRVVAWKPINEVVSGGPSVAEATLTGVLPRPDGITFPRALPPDHTVLTASVDGITFGYSRAMRARLVDTTRTGSTIIGTEQALAYDLIPRTLTQASLPRVTGTHTLTVLAENDFGVQTGPTLVLRAPRPNPVMSVDTSNVPHSPFDPFAIGHSVTTLQATLSSQYALSVRFLARGTLLRTSTHTETEALTTTRRQARMPDTGDFAIGDNEFRLEGSNEFGSEAQIITIHRKDFVFDFVAQLFLKPVDIKAQLVIQDVNPSYLLGIPRGASGGFDVFVTGRDSRNPAGVESLKFSVQHIDGGDRADTLDFRISYFQVTSQGPDYEPFTGFMDIPDTQVVGNESTPLNTSLVDPQALEDGHEYWSHARVRSDSDAARTIVFVIARLLV
jgi:hypothetical protein